MTAPIYVNLWANVDSLFSENQKVFMALRKNFSKINWILVFCLQLLFFWQSDF